MNPGWQRPVGSGVGSGVGSPNRMQRSDLTIFEEDDCI